MVTDTLKIKLTTCLFIQNFAATCVKCAAGTIEKILDQLYIYCVLSFFFLVFRFGLLLSWRENKTARTGLTEHSLLPLSSSEGPGLQQPNRKRDTGGATEGSTLKALKGTDKDWLESWTGSIGGGPRVSFSPKKHLGKTFYPIENKKTLGEESSPLRC